MASFGTSATRVRRSALICAGEDPANSTRRNRGLSSRMLASISHPATAAAALGLRAVVGDRRDVLDPADLHARAGEGADGGLGARTRRAGPVAAGRADAHVQRVVALLLDHRGDLVGGLHGGVGA